MARDDRLVNIYRITNFDLIQDLINSVAKVKIPTCVALLDEAL